MSASSALRSSAHPPAVWRCQINVMTYSNVFVWVRYRENAFFGLGRHNFDVVPNWCAHPLTHAFSRMCASNVLTAHREPVRRSRTCVYLTNLLIYARASPFFSHIMLFMSTFRIFSMRFSWPPLPFLWRLCPKRDFLVSPRPDEVGTRDSCHFWRARCYVGLWPAEFAAFFVFSCLTPFCALSSRHESFVRPLTTRAR